jgi:putative NADH-flavin reductase
MRLTIFAATGRTGRHVLEQAIAASHDVTAVVRNPGTLSAQVRGVTADLTVPDPAALKSAVVGAEAVLSGLGPRNNSEYGITSTGTRAIVDAMKATDVRRLVVVSVAGISTIPTPSRLNPPKTRSWRLDSSCGTCSARSRK